MGFKKQYLWSVNMDKEYNCSLCKQKQKGWGNNPYPLCNADDNESRCCDICNMLLVLPKRFENMLLGGKS